MVFNSTQSSAQINRLSPVAKLLLTLLALNLLSCHKKEIAEPSSSSGMLVYADSMIVVSGSLHSAHDSDAFVAVADCPLLAAGDPVVRKDGVFFQVIDRNGTFGLVKSGAAKIIGTFQFPRPFLGFTKERVQDIVETPSPGALTMTERRGLVFKKENGLDTVYPDKLGKAFPQASPETTMQACAEKIRNSEVRGLIGEFLIPGIECRFSSDKYWIWDKDENGKIKLAKSDHAIQVTRLLSISRNKFLPSAFWAEFASTEGRLWMFSTRPDSIILVAPKIEYPPTVLNVGIKLIDSDSLADFVIETIHYYSDGKYSQLVVLNSISHEGMPSWAIVPLSGSSGEEGGQTVYGSWCVDAAESGSILYVMRQEEEGKEFRVAPYAVGKMGLELVRPSRLVPGLRFTEPESEGAARALLSTWEMRVRSDLCLIPDADGSHWFVGKLFLDNQARARWISGHSSLDTITPGTFEMELIRTSQ